MKLLRTLALLALVAAVGRVSAQTNTDVFNFTVNKLIPDGDPNGLVASTTNLTDFAPNRSIDQVRVTLSLSGGYNGDLYAYLVHDPGGFAVLMNRVGLSSSNGFGYADTGLSAVVFADGAPDVHFYGGNGGAALSGTWGPDGRTLNPLTAPPVSYDLAPRPAGLDSFNGVSPNGQWTLFFADLALGQPATVTGWTLELRTVPEPAALTLALVGGAGLLWLCRRRR